MRVLFNYDRIARSHVRAIAFRVKRRVISHVNVTRVRGDYDVHSFIRPTSSLKRGPIMERSGSPELLLAREVTGLTNCFVNYAARCRITRQIFRNPRVPLDSATLTDLALLGYVTQKKDPLTHGI